MTKLLLIDDEKLNAKYAKILLTQFDVYTVENCTEAFKALESDNFNAVLVDYSLPDMDGVSFLKEATKMYPGLTMFLTSGAHLEEFNKLIGEGVIKAFFEKPYDSDEVQKTMLEHLK